MNDYFIQTLIEFSKITYYVFLIFYQNSRLIVFWSRITWVFEYSVGHISNDITGIRLTSLLLLLLLLLLLSGSSVISAYHDNTVVSLMSVGCHCHSVAISHPATLLAVTINYTVSLTWAVMHHDAQRYDQHKLRCDVCGQDAASERCWSCLSLFVTCFMQPPSTRPHYALHLYVWP